MLMAERTFTIQGEAVAYEVRRSAEASQVCIDAGLDGIMLIVPEGREVNTDEVILEKGDWVLKQRDRFARYRDQMPERRFEEGEAFPVLGTEREVVVENVLFSHINESEISVDSSRADRACLRDFGRQLRADPDPKPEDTLEQLFAENGYAQPQLSATDGVARCSRLCGCPRTRPC